MDITEYYNDSGKVIVIADMPYPYLVNSLSKYRIKLKNLQDKNISLLGHYVKTQKDIVSALEKEVRRRRKST